MPGKSKKGGGLEVGSAYKMKYQGKHSAFPFKSSPTKLDEGTNYTPFSPDPNIPGNNLVGPTTPRSTKVEPHQHGKLNDPDAIVMPGDPEDANVKVF